MAGPIETKNLSVTLSTGDALDIRRFTIHAEMNDTFTVDLVAVCKNQVIELDQAVGKAAAFRMAIKNRPAHLAEDALAAPIEMITWTGVCSELQQLRSEEEGVATYRIQIVPLLWLTRNRTNNRIFQYKNEIEIATELLGEWGIPFEVRLDVQAYKRRKYKVQYEETDFDFFNRMLEEAGVSFWFENEGLLVLSDAPQRNERRKGALTFFDEPNTGGNWQIEYATGIQSLRRVGPGKLTLRDHDYRKPADYNLLSSAESGNDVEKKLEVFDYVEGAFLFTQDEGGDTPVADQRSVTRTDEGEGKKLVTRRLDAQRVATSTIEFGTNCFDVGVGTVLSVRDHARTDLEEKGLVVLEIDATGTDEDDWSMVCLAILGDTAYRPPMKTARPVAHGVDSATVVGPEGEEIWVDEFGRIQVQFHWDRLGTRDEKSSCWIHVSQGWAGTGYGSVMLPRVGQEVLVEYLGGDPDRPIIVGRVYTKLQAVPYGLPANKTQSGIKTNSTRGTGGYNEIMLEDAAGKELFRVQAEKDMNVLVKNNRSTTVRKNCSTSVGVNRSVSVGVNRSTSVGANDTWTVGGSQTESIAKSKTLTAGGPITIHSTGSNVHVEAFETMETWAHKMDISSDTLLTITAGGGMSQILMNDKAIIIDAPKVFVNPGSDEAIKHILETGEPPPVEDEPPQDNVLETLGNIFKQGVDIAIQFGKKAAEMVKNDPSILTGPLTGNPFRIAESVGKVLAGSQTPAPSPMGGGGDFGGGGAGGKW